MQFRLTISRAVLAISWLALATGCNDLERFDTDDSEAYCGTIIGEDFVREGFNADLELELTMDTGQLETRPGRLTSRDADSGPCAPEPLFDGAELRASPKIQADPLSTLDFGSGREHNFFAWADSSCEGTILTVVSLMHDGNVELRLLKPGANATTPGFGVFALERMAVEECGAE